MTDAPIPPLRAAIIPVTNPTSTVIFKCLAAIKAGNTVVHAPHPRAVRCCVRAAEVLAGHEPLDGPDFHRDHETVEMYWRVREGLHGLIGKMRPPGTALIVGPATAVAGAIGFVGLVVPHILRPFVGARPSALLPASALGGAVLLLASDIAVRLVVPDRDLKLGVLTAIVGAPLFLHLIWKTRSGGRV